MDHDSGAASELEQAIAQFEAAAARHRQRRDRPVSVGRHAAPVRRLRRLGLAVTAGALVTALTVVVLLVPDIAGSRAASASARAQADDGSQTPGRERRRAPRAATVVPADHPSSARRAGAVHDDRLPASTVEIPTRMADGALTPSAPRPAPGAAPDPTAADIAPDPFDVGDIERAARLVPLVHPPAAREVPVLARGPAADAAWPAGAPGDLDATTPQVVFTPPLAPLGVPRVVPNDTPQRATPTPSPLLVPYHGAIFTAASVPIVGLASTIFSLYPEPVGSIPFWVSLKLVETDADGRYAVVLGETAPLPADLLEKATASWLGVQPAGEDEQPRVPITGLPCAASLPENRPSPVTDVTCGDPGPARAVDRRSPPRRPAPPLRPGPPPLLPYRGVIHDPTGEPLVGLVSAIFAFYEEATGGLPLWVDIQSLHTGAAGGYTVLLGGTTELPADLFATDAARWLGVQPDGQTEQPRVPFDFPSLSR